MRAYDVIVVGGGPAGSTCSRELVNAGMRVAILDRAEFPRAKLCAGWVTPDVLSDLKLDPAAYPHGLITFDKLIMHVKGWTFGVRTVQHSIRRYEFDDFLLSSSGAERHTHHVKNIRRDNGTYVLDEEFQSRYLVGAGGTRCPVYRALFRPVNPRAKDLQIVTIEQEFPCEWGDDRCHLWFFDDDLPGYSWYVPKANGYLNCGIGALAEPLKRRGQDIKKHWRSFSAKLADLGLVETLDPDAHGYSYYLRGDVDLLRVDNAFIAGDAAGLATLDLGEGIGPAVESGQRVAAAITSGSDYSLDQIHAYSPIKRWLQRLLEYRYRRRRAAS